MTANREARTKPARSASIARFERLAGPDQVLAVEERRLWAEPAKRAYFRGRALKSAQVRRSR